jgi:hypothetical protein
VVLGRSLKKSLIYGWFWLETGENFGGQKVQIEHFQRGGEGENEKFLQSKLTEIPSVIFLF